MADNKKSNIPIRRRLNIPGQTGSSRARVIVLGNEKGGSGKSTTAMHIAISLIDLGFDVATIDLDARQGTLTGHMSNRWMYVEKNRIELPCPTHIAIERSDNETRTESQAEERWRLSAAINEMRETHDFIIIDTPGSDHFITRLGHSYADVLITPINDSFIDLDLFADVDMDDLSIGSPNSYAEMVFDQRKQKALRDGGRIDWYVMRNRLSHLQARNKMDVEIALNKMADRLGFQIAPGFGERVIYRELYLKGLTLMDLKRVDEFPMQLSHISARQEVRSLLNMIGIVAPRDRDKKSESRSENTSKNQSENNHTNNGEAANA